ncbi:MAG: hypothetical protein FWC56_00510 [Phycisphaerae bacterium]|nr:hypothetical protein [Phycisphaerae bacterium]
MATKNQKHWTRTWTIGIATGAMAALICLAGCGSRMTYERWETIRVGSDSPEVVEATLGEPWKKVNDTWVYNKSDQDRTAMIKFKDGKVVGKKWMDVNRGMRVEGEQPTEPGQSEQLRIQTIK